MVDSLTEEGHEVVVIDNLDPAAHDGRPDWLRIDVDYQWGDVTDASVWRAALPGCDALCHQASKVGLGVDFADAPAYVSSNDLGTAVGLAVAHELQFSGRIVLASSMVVYGEGAYTCAEHGAVRPPPRSVGDLEAGRFEPRCPRCGAALQPEMVTEDAPVDPRNVYAATKLQQEYLCRTFAREHPGVTVTALRYHNVYGPRMPAATPYAGVASIFRTALAQGTAPRLFEDGGQRRDFVHVRDVAQANKLALVTPQAVTGAINVASGRPSTLLEMAKALAAAHGEGLRPRVVGGYRLGDVRHVTASIDRAVETLGYRPSVLLADGMAEFATAPLRRPPRRH